MKDETLESLDRESEASNISVDELVEEALNDGFYIISEKKGVEESVGEIKYVQPWGKDDILVEPVGADGEETEKTINTLRRLRDDFPPITAGVDYHLGFLEGGGFVVEIDDPDDKHQRDVRDTINSFNASVYQDETVQGLDAILEINTDEMFTVGFSGAEIVYSKFQDVNSFNFMDWVTPVDDAPEGEPQFNAKPLTDADWKSFGGIVQIKFLDNGVKRLKAYRDKKTYKIQYWTIDEEDIKAQNQGKKDVDKLEVPKLLPWQLFVLTGRKRGSRIKGVSAIRPVVTYAILLEKILKAVGVSIQRWSDRKFFFILGSDKTGRSWNPVKIRGFLRDVNELTKEQKTGIAVPAGFDIKDIGGDVFEGGVITDKLISLICSGLKIPRTFFEQGKTQEGDKAWLAWIVTYAREQKLLKRAIEHQLWERHLRCLFGSTRRVPKQGVPQEDQDQIPVFVPSLAWRSEGKWHIQQKIEQLSRILNVANPVSPVLKLDVEEDIADTLGYSELSFDVAREVLKIEQEIDIIEARQDKLKAQMILESLEQALEKKEHLDMNPMIQGLSQPAPPPAQAPQQGGDREVNPKRPPPNILKRLEGGVSRTTEVTGGTSQKGIAKPQGGTRQPRTRRTIRNASETEVRENLMAQKEDVPEEPEESEEESREETTEENI